MSVSTPNTMDMPQYTQVYTQRTILYSNSKKEYGRDKNEIEKKFVNLVQR